MVSKKNKRGEEGMVAVAQLSRIKSGERYRLKNKKRLNITRRINYYKKKVQQAEKELIEFEKS